jgi:hypothetical protein
MGQAAILFVSTFTTLLAIINPLESLPVILRLLQGKDRRAHRQVARRACTYATLLLFFFLIFGTLLLEIFEVPLSMVRIVGGIILMRIGFSLFMPSAASSAIAATTDGGGRGCRLCAAGDAADVRSRRHRHGARHGLAPAASVRGGSVADCDRRRHPGDDGCSSPMPTRSSAASARAASTRQPASSASLSPRWAWG